MDPHLASYVITYYGHFMEKQEKLAHRHLIGTMKATKGRSDVAAQEEAKKTKPHLRELLSSDPNVTLLAHDGVQTFVERTAARILAEHGDQVFLNYCPRCGALAKTPRARQCRLCRHDWHDGTATQRDSI